MLQAGWAGTLPCIALLILLCTVPAAVEELIGVPASPGAVLDPAMTDHLEEVMAEEGAAYCSGDSPAKAAEFSRKEGFSPAGECAKGAWCTAGTISR